MAAKKTIKKLRKGQKMVSVKPLDRPSISEIVVTKPVDN
jgi:hypothetical protein